MEYHPPDGRWSRRRVVVVLTAAATAYLLVVGTLIGVVAWRGASWVETLSSSASSPAPRATSAEPTPAPSSDAGGAEVAPSGPVSEADATAALKDYDSRNAAAIAKQTRAAWATVDEGPILGEDVWSSRGWAAAKKAGHPFPASAPPTTTLLRLLGSGEDGAGQWFAAVVRFGSGTSEDTFLGVYERSDPSTPFLLRTLDLVDPTAVPPLADPSTWSAQPPSGARAVAPFLRYLTSDSTPGGLDVGSAVEQFLWGAPAVVDRIDYACQQTPVIGPASVPTRAGMLRVADVHCTRTSTAAPGRTFTYNTIDQAIKGRSPQLTKVSCPVTASAAFIARPDGGTDVVAVYLHQTAPCTGTEAAPRGAA